MQAWGWGGWGLGTVLSYLNNTSREPPNSLCFLQGRYSSCEGRCRAGPGWLPPSVPQPQS